MTVSSDTISPNEYFDIDAVNQTLIKHVLRSPAHAKAYLAGDKPPTPAMQFGTAVHASILNSDNFSNEVAVKPDINRRTAAGKVQHEKFLNTSKGLAVITSQQAADCINIAMSIRNSETASRLLNSSHKEQSYLWEDPLTRIVCKARVDVCHPASKQVVDLKTTTDASEQGFARTIAKFGYHIQAAFYLRAASGFDTAVEAYNDGWRFYIVAVETASPFSVASYKLDQRAIIEGDKMVYKGLVAWAESQLLDTFPGYDDRIISISLPRWALTEPEDTGLLGA